MASIVLAAFMCEYVKFTLVPMAVPLAAHYNLAGTTLVNLSAFIYMALAPFASFFAMWLFPRVRLGILLRVAISIQFAGGWFRYLTFLNGQFWPIFAGNVMSAITGPIYILSSIIFTTNWFGDKERTLATAMISMSGALGAGTAFGTDQYFLSARDELDMGWILSKVLNF